MEVICFQEKEEREDQKVVKIKLNQIIVILKQDNNKIEALRKEEEEGQKEQKIELIQLLVALSSFKWRKNLLEFNLNIQILINIKN